MDGTFGGGDLISASLAIMLGGNGDAELHDKEVSLSTSQITGSQTAIFEYDPEDEDPQGTPPGPWDGYSLFTIDLSGVKEDIEDLQQQISDLEDELEACHDCRDDVVEKLQEYDPDYDPDPDECPDTEIGLIIDAKIQIIADLTEQVEECDQCKADVIAKLQEYDPNFDPQSCEDIPPEIDDIAGYDFPVGTDPVDIAELVAGDPVNDKTLGNVAPYSKIIWTQNNTWGVSSGYIDSDGEFQSLIGWDFGTSDPSEKPSVVYAKIVDPTTGTMEYKTFYKDVFSPQGAYLTQTATSRDMIGYGDPSHTYHVSNKQVE